MTLARALLAVGLLAGCSAAPATAQPIIVPLTPQRRDPPPPPPPSPVPVAPPQADPASGSDDGRQPAPRQAAPAPLDQAPPVPGAGQGEDR